MVTIITWRSPRSYFVLKPRTGPRPDVAVKYETSEEKLPPLIRGDTAEIVRVANPDVTKKFLFNLSCYIPRCWSWNLFYTFEQHFNGDLDPTKHYLEEFVIQIFWCTQKSWNTLCKALRLGGKKLRKRARIFSSRMR